jgi:hypothetical protein
MRVTIETHKSFATILDTGAVTLVPILGIRLGVKKINKLPVNVVTIEAGNGSDKALDDAVKAFVARLQ